jgi:nitroreductase
MAHPQLALSNDELLSSTRAVRKRLDFERPVPIAVLEECMNIAVQAPTGSNAQGWQFMFVTDQAKKDRIAEIYAQVWEIYKTMPVAIHHLHKESSTSSAEYLAANMAKAPALLIPCIAGRIDSPEIAGGGNFAQAATYGSIIPAAWSFMLAARARGLGTAWTTLHLMHEEEIANLLGIPYAEYTQVALIPIAYTKGTDFKPAYRPPLDTVMHVDQW